MNKTKEEKALLIGLSNIAFEPGLIWDHPDDAYAEILNTFKYWKNIANKNNTDCLTEYCKYIIDIDMYKDNIFNLEELKNYFLKLEKLQNKEEGK